MCASAIQGPAYVGLYTALKVAGLAAYATSGGLAAGILVSSGSAWPTTTHRRLQVLC